MLSSAHVLAMDAKNLLDVVDSVRIRYPEVEELMKGSKIDNESGVASSSSAAPCPSGLEVSSTYGLPNKITEHITAT